MCSIEEQIAFGVRFVLVLICLLTLFYYSYDIGEETFLKKRSFRPSVLDKIKSKMCT